jgi:Flp pilus assembly protein TadG
MHHQLANTYKQRVWRQRGVSAVELAMVLPVLLLMLDAVLELGLMLHNQSVLSSATNIAARAGAAQGNPKLSTTDIAALATTYCEQGLMSWGADHTAVITVTQTPDPSYQTPLRVSASLTFDGLLIGGVLAAFELSPVIRASTVMYNE